MVLPTRSSADAQLLSALPPLMPHTDLFFKLCFRLECNLLTACQRFYANPKCWSCLKKGFEQCPSQHPSAQCRAVPWDQTRPNGSKWCESLRVFYTMHKVGMRVSAPISCPCLQAYASK